MPPQSSAHSHWQLSPHTKFGPGRWPWQPSGAQVGWHVAASQTKPAGSGPPKLQSAGQAQPQFALLTPQTWPGPQPPQSAGRDEKIGDEVRAQMEAAHKAE